MKFPTPLRGLLFRASSATFVLLGGITAHPLSAAAQFSESQVWSAGEDGYGAHFVYGIAVTAAETVIVGTEGRVDPAGSGDGGNKDLLVKRSTDGGATWGADILIEGSGSDYGYGQPSFVVDGTTVYLFYNYTGSDGAQHLFYRTSIDDGVTWSTRTGITTLWSGNAHGWAIYSPLGHGIKKVRGEYKDSLFLAISHRTTVTSPAASALYGVDVIAKDPGSSVWGIAGETPLSTTYGPNEPSIAERANGNLVIIARNRWDATNNPHSRSGGGDDGGGWGNWVSTASGGLVGAGAVSGGLLRYSDTYHLFSYPDNPGSNTRQYLSIGYSTDGGVNWNTPKLVSSQTCSYSDLARDSQGNIYCIYGRGGNNQNIGGSVWVAKFNLEWVTGTTKTCLVVDNTSASFTTAGTWSTSSSLDGFYGTNYHWSSAASPGTTARWTPAIPATGNYEVYLRWSAFSNRPDAAPVTVAYNGGSQTQNVNQQKEGGAWQLLGVYNFAAGSSGYVELKASDTGSTIADAVMFQQQ